MISYLPHCHIPGYASSSITNKYESFDFLKALNKLNCERARPQTGFL